MVTNAFCLSRRVCLTQKQSQMRLKKHEIEWMTIFICGWDAPLFNLQMGANLAMRSAAFRTLFGHIREAYETAAG